MKSPLKSPVRFIVPGFALVLLAACSHQPIETPAAPAPLSVVMRGASESGPGETLGTIAIRSGAPGAVFALDLHGIPPGTHGFHVHETADCSAAMSHGAMTPAAAAGGHWDPQSTGRHGGPEGDGHLGDLPRVTASADGVVSQTVTAPRIANIDELRGHALMIHAGGDTYSDTPQPLGGGGARIACGVIG